MSCHHHHQTEAARSCQQQQQEHNVTGSSNNKNRAMLPLTSNSNKTSRMLPSTTTSTKAEKWCYKQQQKQHIAANRSSLLPLGSSTTRSAVCHSQQKHDANNNNNSIAEDTNVTNSSAPINLSKVAVRLYCLRTPTWQQCGGCCHHAQYTMGWTMCHWDCYWHQLKNKSQCCTVWLLFIFVMPTGLANTATSNQHTVTLARLHGHMALQCQQPRCSLSVSSSFPLQRRRQVDCFLGPQKLYGNAGYAASSTLHHHAPQQHHHHHQQSRLIVFFFWMWHQSTTTTETPPNAGIVFPNPHSSRIMRGTKNTTTTH